MAVNFSKPIRFKNVRMAQENTIVKFLGILTDGKYAVECVVPGGSVSYVFSRSEDAFENIPQSRWLNVYLGDPDKDNPPRIRPKWHDSRSSADSSYFDKKGNTATQRLAVIEDKQDGSPWILHQL